MKCPNCQVKMEEGYVGKDLRYYKGLAFVNPVASAIPLGKHLIGWRCPNCGKIEFYTEVENKNP